MKNGNLYLGADVGTSALKAVLIDDEDHIVAQTSERYELVNPQDEWLEIDPECWVDAFVTASNRLLESVDRERVKRIGVTGQMHTLVVLDAEGKALRPAIMWNDLRTTRLIRQIKNDISLFEDGEYLSMIISTGSPLANLCWIKQKEPELFKRIRYFQIGWDYLVFRLSGVHITDHCNASSSSMYSLGGRCWSEQISAYLGLGEDCYPKVCDSAEVAGCIEDEFRERLALSPQVEIIVGTGDNPATVIATGGFWNKRPVLSIGTSGVLTKLYTSGSGKYFGKKILVAFHNGDCEELEQGAVQSCGSTYDWWCRQLGGEKEKNALEEDIDITQEVCNQVLFYPHLTGDKTIYSDPDLRGMFAGFDINTSKKTLQYAVIEGICFSIRELSDRMGIFAGEDRSIRVVGGASDNGLWMQILANVLGARVEKLNGSSNPVYGIALLAAKCDAPEELCKIAMKCAEIKATYMPKLDLAEEYERKYAEYLRMRTAVHYIFKGEGLAGA